MILTLYIFLVILALAIIGLGYLTDVPVYTLTGFAFMFLLSVLLFTGQVQYSTGVFTREIYQYGDNFTSYHWDYDFSSAPRVANDAFLFHKNVTTTTTYTAFNDTTSHTIGLFLAVASVLGFVIVLADMRNPRGMNSG